jgi:hypothetical protein
VNRTFLTGPKINVILKCIAIRPSANALVMARAGLSIVYIVHFWYSNVGSNIHDKFTAQKYKPLIWYTSQR